MPHPYELTYPALTARYKTAHDNIGVILSVIEKQCNHLFNLQELENVTSAGWDDHNQFLKFFELCIKNSGDGYTEEEIENDLFPYLHGYINSDNSDLWRKTDLTVPAGCSQEIGLWEKFKGKKLQSDLSKHDVLKNYAFTTLDMSRTAARACDTGTMPHVLELRHLAKLDRNILKNKPLYIRTTAGDKKDLSQWLLLDYKGGQPYLYSESPILEEDKKAITDLLGKVPTIEGGSSALSMSSGMRAASHFIETYGGAGLSTSADYFSLLIEWVWFTGGTHPSVCPDWSWKFFKERTLQWDYNRNEFSLLNFYHFMGSPSCNEHIQMRSYYLGLDWTLADPEIKALTINNKDSTVQLTVKDDPKYSEMAGVYTKRYASKAAYAFSSTILTREQPSSNQSHLVFGRTLVLNVFRACAKEKVLIIDLPSRYQLSKDEKALICYLMEMNPFVCDFRNPQKNASLIDINNNLEHIFARNRWLSYNDYLPPLLDEFWVVAAEYWVAYLKKSPDLFQDVKEVNEFKRCVREMGIYGLVPLLDYLKTHESDLRPAFSALLQNVDMPPTFYAGCVAKDVDHYTQTLLSYLKADSYFPFKRFQFAFVPGANKPIINLLKELNEHGAFDKISLTDCLSSPVEFTQFLKELIDYANKDPNWACPIHIPELEKSLKVSNAAEILHLYSELNNILTIRARHKHANELLEVPTFKVAAQMPGGPAPVMPVPGVVTAAEGKAISSQFNTSLSKIWDDPNKNLPLIRSGGLSLQMQQQQQIKQERTRCLDNEMEKGTTFEDILPSLLIDYTNIEGELGAYAQELNLDFPINQNKATLKVKGATDLQNFFHTWINANPKVRTEHTISKMTPYAAKMLLKYHRQLSGGLNVSNLPRGFYTQKTAAGDLVLCYKSTLGYTTDHNPLTMQLTDSIPKVERILGNHRQFVFAPDQEMEFFLLLVQMQPELNNKETTKRYHEFYKNEFPSMSDDWKYFFINNRHWVENNWEYFYASHYSSFNKGLLLNSFKSGNYQLTWNQVVDRLFGSIYATSPPQQQRIKDLLKRQPKDYTKALGQIYSRYGNYGLERFSNLLLTMEDRLGADFIDRFFEHYLSHCPTFSPLLQDRALSTLEALIDELAKDPHEKQLFEVFLDLHLKAVDKEDITLLWKGFRYFYSNIRDMGLEKEFTPDVLKAIRPVGQNFFPCFERILNSLAHISNPDFRKEFIKSIGGLDLTEGGVPYAVCHDGFVLIHPSLHLTDFYMGAPSYKVPMANLYKPSWNEPLYTLRALASKSHIKPNDYQQLSTLMPPLSKDQLIWVLHTEWDDVPHINHFFTPKDPAVIQKIAHHFHQVFYQLNQPYRRFPLEIFTPLFQPANVANLDQVLTKYKDNLTFFDCCKILYGYNQATYLKELDRIFNLFLSADTPAAHPHLEQGLHLATLFGVSIDELKAFYTQTTKLKQITRNELIVLTNQLQSLDLNSLPQDDATKKAIWQDILLCISDMDNQPLAVSDIRKNLMQTLKAKYALTFKSSISGDYLLVKGEDLLNLGLEQVFEQHAVRLKRMLFNHIAISESEKEQKPLQPLLDFFKRLQLNKTYINEVEPLLTTLENVLKKHPEGCWTAAYLSELLRALEPEDNATGFPIRVLEAILIEPNGPFIPRKIDEIQPHFDPEGKWKASFNAILAKGESFNRKQQANLASLAIRHVENPDWIQIMLQELAHQNFDGVRDVVFDCLARKSPEHYNLTLDQCKDLVHLKPAGISEAIWKTTAHLWIETFGKHPQFLHYFIAEIKSLPSPRKEQIIHVMAYSTMPSHVYPTVPRSNYFNGGERAKAVKLMRSLIQLDDANLAKLSNAYPGKPAPDTRDLLGFMKNKGKTPIADALDLFLTENQAILRQDYKQLSGTRELDLARMLESTYVTRGLKNERIGSEQGAQLMLLFQYLKQLEQGSAALKPLNKMSRDELKQAFEVYSKASVNHPNDLMLKTMIWAILFETLGRTTGKYPHLAQQFALIANDLLISEDPSSILQLKTGEGKSHFVALRAARHAGMGKRVDVCTAKWSLAERDLLDYQEFFNYLGIHTANIQARSPRDSYANARVVYTTPGDLSLFLDEQASQGTPIEVPKEQRVGLGDEFDFLYYEGQKTQFNYARHTGITPKEMSWFYRALNEFNDVHLKGLEKIKVATVNECFDFLLQKANENGRIYLENLPPMALLSWMQSAREAASLKPDIDYTVRLEQVKIGEAEEFPLCEIYPLTKDMQTAIGSTFSHGVHQLLAERLNSIAKQEKEPQNYHVHPESDIISSQVFSQRLKTLWGHWEGFTGTVSSSQAAELNTEHKTAVLRVPTNQKDLRKWPEARFFEEKDARLPQMVADIKKRITERKSILLCCATDAEVNQLDAALQTCFSPEEYKKYFLSYTNKSPKSPAEILREKNKMEGDYLGQKERGVVLIAAGFGRGDNVGVETVMLSSVHDENDLGQKGGRTARNGEEGEVLQYYITKDIENELMNLHALFYSQPALLHQIKTALQIDPPHPLAAIFNEPKAKKAARDLAQIDGPTKFKLLLRLREFLAAQDNYPSLMYHESKAMLSSEGIRLIGQAKPEEKERIIKEFATYLNDLEKSWIEIQANAAYDTVDTRLDALYREIETNIEVHGKLTHTFRDVGSITFKRPTTQRPKFMLDSTPGKPTYKEQLVAAAQGLLLRLVDLPQEGRAWGLLAHSLAQLDEKQLDALLLIFRKETVIPFDKFKIQIQELRKPHKAEEELKTLKPLTRKQNVAKLKDLLSPNLERMLRAMPPESSDLAWEYLVAAGIDDRKKRIELATPLIEFSSQNPACVSYWNSPEIRDALLSLPPGCLANLPPLDAEVLLSIKKFLDRSMVKDPNEYYSLFRQLAFSLEHQSEHRKRFLSRYELILESTKKSQPVLLKQLAELSQLLSAPEHFVVLKTLIEKMTLEYQKPRVPIEELDRLWDNLLNIKDNLLDLLDLVQANLATEGKEFLPLLEVICQSDPTLMRISKPFLKQFFSRIPPFEEKSARIQLYKDTINVMGACLSDQKPVFLEELFRLFDILLTNEVFAKYQDKRTLFEGMKAIVVNKIKEEDLFPNYSNVHKLRSLVYLCGKFPLHTKTLLSLDLLADYLSPNKTLSDIQANGLEALLTKVPEEISLNQLNLSLRHFYDANQLDSVFYLCQRFPDHAVNILSLGTLIDYLSPNRTLSETETKGLEALLAEVPKKISINQLNTSLKDFYDKDQIACVLSLSQRFPDHAVNILSLGTLVDYLSPNRTLSETETKGLEALLAEVPKKISINQLNTSLKDFYDKDQIACVLSLSQRFPEHAINILSLETLVDYSTNKPLSEPEAKGIEALLAGISKTLTVNQLNTSLQLFGTQDKMYDLLYLSQRFPEHALDLVSEEPLTSYLHTDFYQKLSEGEQKTYLAGLNAMFDKEIPKVDKKFTHRVSSLSDNQKQKLFSLFNSFPSFITKSSDADFLPWVDYLCSKTYETQSDELRDATIPGIRSLLEKGINIFKNKNLAQFRKPEQMAMLLSLAEEFPQQSDKLLALKPLISLITNMKPDQQAVARKAVGNFLNDLNQHKTSFAAIKNRMKLYKSKELMRLLDYWQYVPDHAVSIFCNNLASNTKENEWENLSMISEFYQQEDKTSWISSNLMSMPSEKRVKFLTLLKKGAFITEVNESKCQKFSAQMNKVFFKAGMDCYKEYIDTNVNPPKPSKARYYRGLSSEHQGHLHAVMEEFKQIGTADFFAGATSKLRDEVAQEIKTQIETYKQIRRKDNARYKLIKNQIKSIQDEASSDFKPYSTLLTELSEIKTQLLNHDAKKAAHQIIPRLHFLGQSRLYRMLNDMEDTLIKAWVEDSRLQLDSASKFSAVSEESRTKYIDAFKKALLSFNNQPHLFARSTQKLAKEIHSLETEDLVQYLKGNSKMVNNLPGALKTMAHEILAHDVQPIGKIQVPKSEI
jgi:hypothetical protein